MEKQPENPVRGDRQEYFQDELQEILRTVDVNEVKHQIPKQVLYKTAMIHEMPSISMVVRIGEVFCLDTDWIFEELPRGNVLLSNEYSTKKSGMMHRPKDYAVVDIGYDNIKYEQEIVWKDKRPESPIKCVSDFVKHNKGMPPKRLSGGKEIVAWGNVDFFAYQFNRNIPVYKRRFFYVDQSTSDDLEYSMAGVVDPDNVKVGKELNRL